MKRMKKKFKEALVESVLYKAGARRCAKCKLWYLEPMEVEMIEGNGYCSTCDHIQSDRN